MHYHGLYASLIMQYRPTKLTQLTSESIELYIIIIIIKYYDLSACCSVTPQPCQSELYSAYEFEANAYNASASMHAQ